MKRAFTILEVVVALTLGVVVLGAVALVLEQVLIQNRRQHILSEMQRDGAFASELMAQEIRQAGLGVPTGRFVMQDAPSAFIYGTNSSATANPLVFASRHLLVAGASSLAFVGDLATPNANYATFGPIDDRASDNAAPPTHIAWHTEQNGSCIPEPQIAGGPAATTCSTQDTSMFYPGVGAACASGSSAITCPWGNNRIHANERLQIIDGGGLWSISTTGASLNAALVTNSAGDQVLALPLAQSYDLGAQLQWPNASPGDGPGGTYGQGWVTTLDRVFYKVTGTNLQREQCQGDPDPNNANWPPDGSNQIPATQTYTPAASSGMSGKVAATTCFNGFETIARNIATTNGLVFKYFKNDGTDITATLNNTSSAATLETIARVQWTITLQKVDAQVGTVTYQVEGGTALSN